MKTNEFEKMDRVNESLNKKAQSVAAESAATLVELIANVKKQALASEELKVDEHYQELLTAKAKACAAVEEYELNAVQRAPQYMPLALQAVRVSLRLFAKRYEIASINEKYLSSEIFENSVKNHSQYFDTTARLAAFITGIYKDLQSGKTKTKAKTPYTEAEQAQLKVLIGIIPGYTEDFVKKMIEKGK